MSKETNHSSYNKTTITKPLFVCFRDHPETIKLRSLRAVAVCIISPFFVQLWSHKSARVGETNGDC